ncbi:MAG TPA: hypothetical protein VJP80_04465 [Candidatus Saccharimonadales bacterium]|nr:hypothetical protein [Candidatus Saccharimonadales bacterium]
MPRRTLYVIVQVLILLLVLIAVRSLWIMIGDGMSGHVRWWIAAIFFCSVALGLIASVTYYALQSRYATHKTQQQVNVETLAAYAKARQKRK